MTTRAWGPICLGIYLLALPSMPASATAVVVDKKQDDQVVRRVEKIYIRTERQLGRRAHSSTCPTSFSLCPSSLSGGCCPINYACETDSCVRTAPATTASACGLAGYINCGISAGGGCCPSGYVCGLADCTAPAGVSESDNCPTGYYLCPSPYNYGCCQTTMGCALNACYATTPSTFVFTATFTTKTGRTGKPVITTVTSTTVETPTVPSGLPDDTNIYIPKFIPTTQAKASEVAVASNSTESSSSGLTKPQIGGLIGGLMALLVIVVVAAVFIIRSLQKTSKAVKRAERRNTGGAGTGNSSRHTPKDSGGGGGGTRPPKMQPTPSQINQMEYNDLLENVHSESPLPPSGPRKPNMSSTSGSTPVPPFPSAHGKISSDFSSPSNGVDGEPVTGYFDTPTSSQSRPGHVSVSTDVRTSTDSQNQRQRYRSRIASNASELSGESNVVGSPLQPAELGVDGGFIPELPPSTTGGFMHAPYVPHAPQTIQPLGQAGVDPEMQQPLMTGHARDWSGSSATTSAYAPNYAPGPAAGYAPGYAQGHSRERSNSSQQTQHHQQPPRLTAVAEAAENLHGHYGPTNLAVGQTQTYTENGNGEGPANAQ